MSAYNSPYDPKSSYSTLNGGVNAPVAASVVGHIIVLFLIIFGIPFIAKNPEVLYEPIPVEIISSSELAEELNPQEETVETPEPPPIVERAPTMVEETPPEPVPEPVIEDIVPEPVQPPPPIETPESEVEENIKPEKPVMLPTRKPKPPPPKKVEPKKEEPKQEDKMKALLTNLANSEPTPAAQPQNNAPSIPKKGISAGQLNFSEIDAVRAQIEGCWYFPAGAKYAEELVVTINLVMNTNRTVRTAKISDMGRYQHDTAYRAAADAAMRAIRNPNCTPLKLPPAKYDEWKTITLNFDPRGVL